MATNTSKAQKIAELNDRLRQTGLGGRTLITEGIQALSDEDRAAVMQAVRTFDAFNPDNDPNKEHDFALVECPNGIRVFFKLDYYDKAMEFGSEDPADPAKTNRVLTIMLPNEY